MAKTYRICILLGLLGLSLIFLIFAYQNDYKSKNNIIQKEVNDTEKTTIQPEIMKADEIITVSLRENDEEKELRKNEEVLVISKSLQPIFVIKKNKKISDLRIYFDGSKEDLLSSRFSSVEPIEYDKDQNLKVKFTYTLEPKKHKIIVKYNTDNQEIVEEYSFLLVLFDDFSTPLYKSKLWGMTKEASELYNNWEVKDGRLIANTLPNEAKSGAISSLFFIQRFQGDFFVEFDLMPKSNIISFNTYLLERKLNFVFGNGNNKDVVILNKYGARGDFVFESLKTYRIRLVRNQNIYKVFIAIKNDFSDSNSLFDYLDNDLILTYGDKEQLKIPFDAFGFTIWKNSGGVEIDNFYTANEDISDFEFYD